jgi:hypothetical protein
MRSDVEFSTCGVMLVLKHFKLRGISDFEMKGDQPVHVVFGEGGIPSLDPGKTPTEIETCKNGDVAHVAEHLPSKGKDLSSN